MAYDVIVIGAGIIGTSSALALAEEGLKTLVIDSLRLKNDVNASNDVSRIFRTYHPEDDFKSRMAESARIAWEALADRYPKRDIFRQCDLVALDPTDAQMPEPTSDISWLGEAGVRYLFPVFGSDKGILDRSAGILHARNATVAMAKAAKTAGAHFLHGRAATDVRNGSVILEGGKHFDADQVVIACGAWADRFLGGRVRIRATRQEVAFFRPEPLPAYAYGRFPIFAHLPTWFYGFPDHGVGAVKVARHVIGPSMDPAETPREARPEFIEACRAFLSETVPGMADAELLRSRTCRYAVRDGEEFLIDRLDDRTVVATAFRGEGFKFAPLVGRIVADLAEGRSLAPEFSRFRL